MDNNLTTTSILALFETNKEQRLSFVNDMLVKIDAGEVNPLQVHLQVKCMEDIIKQLTISPSYKNAILAEAEKFGQKSFSFHEAKIEIKEVGVKYDFSKCEDAGLFAMYENQKQLDEAIKKRETLLKSVPAKGMTITDEDTGETYTVYPPSKSSTTLPVVTLK